MPEENLPAWAIRIGAEVRERTDQLPVNEPYLVEVTELLREMTERELADQRRRCGAESGELISLSVHEEAPSAYFVVAANNRAHASAPFNTVTSMPVDRKKDALPVIGKLLRSELTREPLPHHPDIEHALRRLIERDVAERSRFQKADSWQSREKPSLR